MLSRLMTRREQWLVFGLTVALGVGAVSLFVEDQAGVGETAGAERVTLVDLNHASVEELAALPGIGPSRAERIVAYRTRAPFQRVEDVLRVEGIGPKTLDGIRPLVTVR